MSYRNKKNNHPHPRNLVYICTEEGGMFFRPLKGIAYCGLCMGRNKSVNCPYASPHKDHNGLFPCTFPEYQKIAKEGTWYFNNGGKIH